MLYRTLGRIGLQVSIAGLGTGGPSRLGQNTGRTGVESHQIVRTALDLGINLFDTSPGYGRSEQLLGQALRGIPRDRYVLATKFGPYEGKAIKADTQALLQQLERSLRLLGVDYVDLLQYHGLIPKVYREVIDRFHSIALRAQEAGKGGRR